MTDTIPNQSDRQKVRSIIANYEFQVINSDGASTNELIREEAITAIQAIILEAQIQELDLAHRNAGEGFDNSTDEYIDDRITDLKAQLEQLKGRRG